MHLWPVLPLLILLALANGTPVIVNRLRGRRGSCPVDGGARWMDGRPLFGPSKTVRGILFSVLVTAAGAPLAGLNWKVGAVTGVAAMAGDLFSSFFKRRIGIPSGGRATGLDQIPESLFPLLACRYFLPLTALEITAAVAVFFLGEVLLSLLFYRWHLRERPY
jgi:CDP-2,3-bis-(O-geranylgeranyl)-sn-glycerol synthase